MTAADLLRSITAQVTAFKAGAAISAEDAAEIDDLQAQYDSIKHEGARTAITREIDRKNSLAQIAAARRADAAVRELYDDAAFKRAFGIRVRSNQPSELDDADAENLAEAGKFVPAPAADEMVPA